ncbi:hypothetical protein I316_02470 [Kwoniella heveanensis BCC8398]|uniref:Uncharacterized protein n=1 Tax=Kwoniella heveanensis BCC8398 TaxID=1296120 RepID=A0A1B9GYD2_9TREE|nr:hypothetical protein I316_02470 [Kwoniella heveanensis BCC8398]
MNKRTVSTGLPTKPYMQHAPAGLAAHGPGPAPPLPSGPPPQQAYGQVQGQDPAAAHAAAWAAYYQAQAQAAPPQQAYAGPVQLGAPVAGGGANPYANYGYGAGAQHSSTYPQAVQPAQPVAGPSQPYRPPPNTQAYATAATQPSMPGYSQQPQYAQQGQVYSPQGAAGYQTPQPQPRPPYQTPQQPVQQGYAWGAPQQPAPAVPTGPAYRPPQAQPQAAPFYPQQPSYNTPAQPYRPPRTPQPGQNNSPYRPPMGNQPRPPRPSMSTPPHPSGAGFPPAKRPRFDGPGGGVNGGQPGGAAAVGVGMNNVRPPSGPSMQNVRPPTAPAAFAAGTNGGQPGFNTGVPSRPSGIGRGGAPIPVSRPPIHLGGGGPPPQIGLGGASRGVAPLRGGLAGRGRGGGPMNAPRGPSGMRRPDTRSSLPPKKDPGKEKVKDKKREVELRTTMTDFRIVGIEVKEIGWSWGKINGHDEVEVKAEKEEHNGTGENLKEDIDVAVAQEVKAESGEEKSDATEAENGPVETKQEGDAAQNQHVTEEAVPEEAVKTETTEETDVLADTNGDVTASAVEAVEEKRGEKRKAKTPDAEDETLSKKRTPYLLTHNKPNHSTTTAGAPGETFDSNQNRFRIYFDSPPELDRIPKAERKNAAAQAAANPHKRGRRESSSVAPSRAGDATQEQQEEQLLAQDTVGEEAAAAESGPDGPADETKEDEIKENGENVGGESVAQTEGLSEVAEGSADPIEIAEIASVVPDAPAAGHEANAEHMQPESVHSEIPAEASLAPADEQAEGTVEVHDAANADPGAEQVEAAETTQEAGDMSMLTDPGIIGEISGSEVESSLDNIAQNGEVPSTIQALTVAGGQTEQSTADITAVDEANESTVDPSTDLPDDGEATSSIPSAEATASALKTSARRLSSVSNASQNTSTVVGDVPNIVGTDIVPSTNRLSILYEKSSRRICLDSDVVEKVRIWRKEGRIEVEFKHLVGEQRTEGEETVIDLPKGILIENYDTTDQRFVPLTRARLSSFYPSDTPTAEGSSIPPFHKSFLPKSTESTEASSDVPFNGTVPELDNKNGSTSGGVVLTVYLNKKNPLSEPKWCRTNSADGWLLEQFGVSARKDGQEGWTGKLEVMDPDPAPTLKSILESWSSTSTAGTSASRQDFTASLLSSPLDTLEILLRLTRGERNTPYSPSSTSAALASAVRSDSPYASHQTHVSLAVLAMYRLTTDYAEKLGGSAEKTMVEEKVGDIIRSLPSGMIHRSLEGMWREWSASKKDASQAK